MPLCAICAKSQIDLSQHIMECHSLSAKDYREIYQQPVVDASVEDRRKQTCLDRYGDPNYKNKEATKLSNEIYKGGHSLRDPDIREKGRQTKNKLYGDPNFTNREKASETCLKRYGVKNVNQVKEIKQRAVKTSLERYGKVFNYIYTPPFNKEDLIDLHINKRMSLAEIGDKYGVTGACISYWMKKFGVQVIKRVTKILNKEYTPISKLLESYLNTCIKNGVVLSFYEYGKIDNKGMQKMKRAFNNKGKYHNLKEELFLIALSPEKWPEFLAKIESK